MCSYIQESLPPRLFPFVFIFAVPLPGDYDHVATPPVVPLVSFTICWWDRVLDEDLVLCLLLIWMLRSTVEGRRARTNRTTAGRLHLAQTCRIARGHDLRFSESDFVRVSYGYVVLHSMRLSVYAHNASSS